MKLAKYNPRKDMPTWKAIKEYWVQTSIFKVKQVDSLSENFCFACTRKFHGNLERAHINALWAGGSNAVENLHLLCSICHKDSENFGFGRQNSNFWIDFDQSIYWKWFFERNPSRARFSEYVRSLKCIEDDPSYATPYGFEEFLIKFTETYRYDKRYMEHLLKIIDMHCPDSD